MEKWGEEEEEVEIRTTMQSSVVMQQSCTHQPRQLFLSSEQGGGEGKGGGGEGGGKGEREREEVEEEKEEGEEEEILTAI